MGALDFGSQEAWVDVWKNDFDDPSSTPPPVPSSLQPSASVESCLDIYRRAPRGVHASRSHVLRRRHHHRLPSGHPQRLRRRVERRRPLPPPPRLPVRARAGSMRRPDRAPSRRFDRPDRSSRRLRRRRQRDELFLVGDRRRSADGRMRNQKSKNARNHTSRGASAARRPGYDARAPRPHAVGARPRARPVDARSPEDASARYSRRATRDDATRARVCVARVAIVDSVSKRIERTHSRRATRADERTGTRDGEDARDASADVDGRARGRKGAKREGRARERRREGWDAIDGEDDADASGDGFERYARRRG